MEEARPFVSTFNPSDIDSAGTIGPSCLMPCPVTESPRFLHARQRRLNVIQITKRHLGLETWAPAAVPAGLLHVRVPPFPPPPLPLCTAPTVSDTPGQTLISSSGIKTNIFSLNQTWMRRWYQERLSWQGGRMLHSWLHWAAVTLSEALIRLFWHRTLIWGGEGGEPLWTCTPIMIFSMQTINSEQHFVQ